ncbi:hypothetical protein [Streptomyces sp. NPDC048111]|uniref:hypothetical protein n=1 Tax=Streptomyces sp. NPDC048111 TaxID=3365500 RepID=UPI00371F0783
MSPWPAQPPTRETLAPESGAGPGVRAAASPVQPRPAVPDRPHLPLDDSKRGHGRARAAERDHAPAPRHHQDRRPPAYDPGQVCAWAQGTGFDPSIVRACREQLGH